jgi:hypothetical protein
MSDIAYDVSCGVVLIEQHCAEEQVVCWHLFDGRSPRIVRQTVILHFYCVSSCSGCLKISGRKLVCELLLAGRSLDFLFTHFFNNRFDEFGNCQKRSVVVFWGDVFSFHVGFRWCDGRWGLLKTCPDERRGGF